MIIMNGLPLRSAWLGCVIAAAMLAGNFPAEAQTVLRVVGNSAPPYRIIEGTQFSGIYFDAIAEIAKRIGVTIEFSEAPMKRAFLMMKYGEADVMVGPNKTPEREEFMVYSNAVFPSENKVFYAHQDASCVTRYEDLPGKTVSVYRGAVYFEPFDTDSSILKELVNDYEFAFKQVQANHADFVIIPEHEGDYRLKQLQIPLKKCPYVVEGRPSYITISKKSPAMQLQTQIEDAMAEIQADGTFAEILKRYK